MASHIDLNITVHGAWIISYYTSLSRVMNTQLPGQIVSDVMMYHFFFFFSNAMFSAFSPLLETVSFVSLLFFFFFPTTFFFFFFPSMEI